MNYSCQLWPARKELSNSAQTGRQFRTFRRSSLTSVLSRPRYLFPSFKNVRNLTCLHIVKANSFICPTYFLNRRPGASVTKKVGFKTWGRVADSPTAMFMQQKGRSGAQCTCNSQWDGRKWVGKARGRWACTHTHGQVWEKDALEGDLCFYLRFKPLSDV